MSSRPIIDAGPALNFLAINKERVLTSVVGRISTPESVENEVFEGAQSFHKDFFGAAPAPGCEEALNGTLVRHAGAGAITARQAHPRELRVRFAIVRSRPGVTAEFIAGAVVISAAKAALPSSPPTTNASPRRWTASSGCTTASLRKVHRNRPPGATVFSLPGTGAKEVRR